MAELKKEDTIFPRDEEGKLLPIEVALELLEDKPTIRMIPVARGKLQKVFSKATKTEEEVDIDGEIIENYCIKPKYSKEEIEVMKPKTTKAIVTAILATSLDIKQEDFGKPKKAVNEQEAYLKKK